MPAPTKASDIELTPIPGKKYFNLEREWREELIYFLMTDRFHDDQARSPVLQTGRSNGVSTPDDFFGGKIKRDHQSPRLRNWIGLHSHLAFTHIREQSKDVPRLQH